MRAVTCCSALYSPLRSCAEGGASKDCKTLDLMHMGISPLLLDFAEEEVSIQVSVIRPVEKKAELRQATQNWLVSGGKPPPGASKKEKEFAGWENMAPYRLVSPKHGCSCTVRFLLALAAMHPAPDHFG